MADSHLKNIERRPKRRKDKDNPYTIFTTGINTATPHYYLSFVDCGWEKRCIEIDKALFDAFDKFELYQIFLHAEICLELTKVLQIQGFDFVCQKPPLLKAAG